MWSLFGQQHFHDNDGPDRSFWSDKSQAALRREADAKRRFDTFLEKSKSAPSFPLTEEVIPPDVHLTDKCWQTFKNYVISKGCTAKRRLVAPHEIKIANDRNKKRYAIIVTAEGHPDEAPERCKNAQARALAAREKREKKELRKAEEERNLKTKISEEYTALESFLTNEIGDEDAEEPPEKRQRITVPIYRMLAHADTVHQTRLHDISKEIAAEERAEILIVSQKWKEKAETRKAEEALRVQRIKDMVA